MRIRRIAATACSLIASTVLVLVGTVTPAHAATGWDRCPIGTFCVFEHVNGEGKYAYFVTRSPDLTKPIGGFVFNDKISSYWNRNDSDFCVYENIGFGGGAMLIRLQTARANMSSFWNDRVSSLQIRPGPGSTTC